MARTTFSSIGVLTVWMIALAGSDAMAQTAAPRTPDVPTINGGDFGPAPSIPDLVGVGDEIGDIDRNDPRRIDAPAIANEICVIFPPASAPNEAQAFADDLDLDIVREFTQQGLGLRVYLMRLGDGVDPGRIFAQAQGDQRPLWVQPNFVYRANQDGSAGGSEQQYALHQMRADMVDPKTDGGAGISIALVDSGVDLAHESLVGAKIDSIDLIEGESSTARETHGTVLASIMVGQGPLFGIAPRAHLIAIRAFREVDGQRGLAESSSFLLSLGIDTAIRKQARIINLSLTGPQDRLVAHMVTEALMRRIHIVAAAGNDGREAAAAYPAAQDGVIAVTATDMYDQLYQQANRGDYISVAAPGVDILGAKPGGSYDFFTGTSMATGYVSGLAALMLATQPDLGIVKLRVALEKSAIDLGPPQRDPEYGAGRIDAASAISLLPQ